ncbi:patatin-like phospholipase family protein [Paenirhodobacter populi]|uniref:Patatin n=1 Tax=Paenirhodobacter populi TaxID=2306993 RepID=A0A443IYP3_9RHOB|nr:patatin-like phospholipase family protein [Sinirhodobacter populi]RWR13241.1 patatin [Sinirhodobacter populi]
MAEEFRILSLDGGGAKGFYTLGVLREVEAMLGGAPLCESFDLIYGTSTGSIIAALLALGQSVTDVVRLYDKHVVNVVGRFRPASKSAALTELAREVFEDQRFDAFKTEIGIVATRWMEERPMIFKTSMGQAHGSKASFVPGFGCTIGEAVQASCSAYPFFKKKTVTTSKGERVQLIDGGFCANNPALYAIADATNALGKPLEQLRVLSVGVGECPPIRKVWNPLWWYGKMPPIPLIQKTLEINTQSMEQLRSILFRGVRTVRISDPFTEPEMATDLFECDKEKLNRLMQRGTQSFAKYEADLATLLT